MYNKKDFTFEEDYIISVECDDCETYSEDEAFLEDTICPECGGMLITTTAHEDCQCFMCGNDFDSWDKAYRHTEDDECLICEECYNNLD